MGNLQLLSPVMTVESISKVKQDKNGINYKTLTLKTLGKVRENHAGIDVIVTVPVRNVTINQWESRYLDGKTDSFYNSKVDEVIGVEAWRATGLNSYELPDRITGEIVERESITFGVERGQSPESYLKARGMSFAREQAVQNVEVTQDSPFED